MTKRIFDFVASLLLLILLLPVLILLATVVYFTLGKPILYKQMRPGLREEPFILYKFRTLLDLREKNGNPLPDEKRISRFGRFLRSTSLDELPELWNVLRGEMSLVGPRPLLMQYLPRYNAEQRRRHDVKPGITGWAQIHGRNALSWEERFNLDLWYVDHRNSWIDLKILCATMIKVFQREGINAQGHVTMPEFLGSDPSKVLNKKA